MTSLNMCRIRTSRSRNRLSTLCPSRSRGDLAEGFDLELDDFHRLANVSWDRSGAIPSEGRQSWRALPAGRPVSWLPPTAREARAAAASNASGHHRLPAGPVAGPEPLGDIRFIDAPIASVTLKPKTRSAAAFQYRRMLARSQIRTASGEPSTMRTGRS